MKQLHDGRCPPPTSPSCRHSCPAWQASTHGSTQRCHPLRGLSGNYHHQNQKKSNPLPADFLQEDITKQQEWSKKWVIQFHEEKYSHAPWDTHHTNIKWETLHYPPEAEKGLGVSVSKLPVKPKCVPIAAEGLRKLHFKERLNKLIACMHYQKFSVLYSLMNHNE